MKNTKTNLIKLLKELQEEAGDLLKTFQVLGNEAGVEHNKGRYLAYGTVIGLLTDEDYFNYAYNSTFKK
ncbi:MAG: hypothetical protein QXY78_03935 [Thermoplasmata archaeon]